MLYHITFIDNTTYNGGESVFDSKWLQIPKDKKIKTLFYSLPFGDYLVLSGYDKYYHNIEGVEDLNGKNAGKVNIEYIYLIGKIKDKAIRYKIDIKKQTIIKEMFKCEDKEIKELNVESWR